MFRELAPCAPHFFSTLQESSKISVKSFCQKCIVQKFKAKNSFGEKNVKKIFNAKYFGKKSLSPIIFLFKKLWSKFDFVKKNCPWRFVPENWD